MISDDQLAKLREGFGTHATAGSPWGSEDHPMKATHLNAVRAIKEAAAFGQLEPVTAEELRFLMRRITDELPSQTKEAQKYLLETIELGKLALLAAG